MKKLLSIGLILTACMGLAACDNAEEEAKQLRYIQQQLPEGCVVMDLGEYDDLDVVLLVQCQSAVASVVNSNETQSNGKTSTELNGAVIKVGK